MRAFHTGDMGFVADGVLTLCGRTDLQIQIKGAACPQIDTTRHLCACWYRGLQA